MHHLAAVRRGHARGRRAEAGCAAGDEKDAVLDLHMSLGAERVRDYNSRTPPMLRLRFDLSFEDLYARTGSCALDAAFLQFPGRGRRRAA